MTPSVLKPFAMTDFRPLIAQKNVHCSSHWHVFELMRTKLSITSIVYKDTDAVLNAFLYLCEYIDGKIYSILCIDIDTFGSS